jgi:NAD(P)H dehydrogenase (quinone)
VDDGRRPVKGVLVNVLVMFAHPRRDSFSGAILDSLCAGLTAAGHTVEVGDLYRQGFDPRLRPEDYAQFEGNPMPDDVLAEQARVERADALAFVFPVWWWSLPAMLKGWIDRVFASGWAYEFTPSRSRGLLRDRPTLLLCVAGSREATYRKYGYDTAMHTQIDVGILGYCGIRDIGTEFFYEVDDDEASRPLHLEKARRLGVEFLSPERVARDIGLDSLRIS